MMNKNERIEALKANGINTSKYFTVDLDNGTKIHLIIDENGNPMVVDKKEEDPIVNEIIESGYVRNTKLHRRWVMAQMFHHLNYVSYDGQYSGYTDCINRSYGYDYTFKMMLEEVRVLSKLETRDRESFKERSRFFTKAVVAAVVEDYVEKLKAYVDKLQTKKCKGIPYKRIKGNDIFVADLHKKLYQPALWTAIQILTAKNYNEVYRLLGGFMRTMIKLPWQTSKSKDWMDAYKGSGAFYTCKNLIMFHNCLVEMPNGVALTTAGSMEILEAKLDEYQSEGWRMFAFMNKLIADNEIDTKTYIAEICDK